MSRLYYILLKTYPNHKPNQQQQLQGSIPQELYDILCGEFAYIQSCFTYLMKNKSKERRQVWLLGWMGREFESIWREKAKRKEKKRKRRGREEGRSFVFATSLFSSFVSFCVLSERCKSSYEYIYEVDVLFLDRSTLQ